MSQENKSEKPTPQKLKEARDQGQIAKSQDFNTVFSIFIFVALAFVFYEKISINLADEFVSFILLASTFELNTSSLLALFHQKLFDIVVIILPVILLIALFNILISVAQTGLVLSTHPLKPKFDKLNPAAGLKKIFSKRTLFELFKSLFKLMLFSTLLYFSYDWVISVALDQFNSSPQYLPYVWVNTLLLLITYFACLFIPVAFADFAFSRFEFTKKMMMSKSDVKDEAKKRDGDPEVKQKQKKNQKELLEKTNALSNVKNADVVITNPTHIAVALRYDPKTMVSPQVLAMGKGGLALKIRKIAHRYQVVTIQNRPLARKLYKETQINSFVPISCYGLLVPVFRQILNAPENEGNN